MIYRRKNADSVWHFCHNCSAWPTEDCQERIIEPQRDSLCSQCIAKNARLECEVVPVPGTE